MDDPTIVTPGQNDVTEVKPGYKTTEFYLALAPVIVLVAKFAFDINLTDTDGAKLVELFITAGTAIAGIVAWVTERTKVKTASIEATSKLQIARLQRQ